MNLVTTHTSDTWYLCADFCTTYLKNTDCSQHVKQEEMHRFISGGTSQPHPGRGYEPRLNELRGYVSVCVKSNLRKINFYFLLVLCRKNPPTQIPPAFPHPVSSKRGFDLSETAGLNSQTAPFTAQCWKWMVENQISSICHLNDLESLFSIVSYWKLLLFKSMIKQKLILWIWMMHKNNNIQINQTRYERKLHITMLRCLINSVACNPAWDGQDTEIN